MLLMLPMVVVVMMLPVVVVPVWCRFGVGGAGGAGLVLSPHQFNGSSQSHACCLCGGTVPELLLALQQLLQLP